MKTKLTLTVEKELIRQAKSIAEAEQTSISSMVETFFSNLSLRNRASFAQKWRGAFKQSPRAPRGIAAQRAAAAANTLRR